VTPGDLPPTTALADVLLIHRMPGVLSPPLSSFTQIPDRVSGAARTVQLEPAESADGSLDPLYALLDEDLTGAVVVVAGAEEVKAAVWGQILARAARRAGAVAAVVAGAVRDREELTGEGVPVWALCERTVGAVGVARVAAADEPVFVGDAPVEPGDTVVVDPHGVVALPGTRAGELLAAALDLTAGEEALLAELEGGGELARAYAHKRNVVDRIRDG
jgi:4-hydroxy-4-methyl-2-oxoglutarate aldolase